MSVALMMRARVWSTTSPHISSRRTPVQWTCFGGLLCINLEWQESECMTRRDLFRRSWRIEARAKPPSKFQFQFPSVAEES